jgi:hypothetical protein
MSIKVDLLTIQEKLLETQVAQQVSSSSRQYEQLLSKPYYKLNASVKVITLRSETVSDGSEMPKDDEYNILQKQPEGQPENQAET